MKFRSPILLVLIIACIFISGCNFSSQVINENAKILDSAQVVRVIDGDTLELASGEHVRLLHINTPEKEEYCYAEAKERLTELVLNKTIWLERDMQSTDKYNRSLRYIYLSNDSVKSVNQQMIEEGFAVVYILLPNTRYKDGFFESEEIAIKNKQGCLWQNSSKWQGCIKVQELKTCKDGDYAVLKNDCDDIMVDGWLLRNQGRDNYLLNGTFAENSTIKIIREGWETTHECIWSDWSSTLFLFDSGHEFVLRYHY
jgi:micrococcal nuclease